MTLHFYKYQGTGNDFILIDNREGDVTLSRELIARLCDRHFGIGADGLMLLEIEPGFDFRMVYYNKDGNESTMCGNGGRCICAFASRIGIVGDSARFIAIDGEHIASIEEEYVRLKMRDTTLPREVGGYTYLDTGSPHVVVLDTPDGVNVLDAGAKIRYTEAFAPDGVNVNFITGFSMDPLSISVRTYERGVEDETLSCGTGVTASAIVFTNPLGLPIDASYSILVETEGGELEVQFTKRKMGYTDVWLCGPAKLVFQGEIRLLKEDLQLL